MTRIIHPPVGEHEKLRQPMTAGERRVLDFFDRNLNPDWEIYIQSHLNGLRPDFVLLNPHVGIAVFEVKDWNLDAMRYFTEKDSDGDWVLCAERDGKKFSVQSNNPVTKVNSYKKKIYNVYCPRLKSKFGFAAITAGIIFPFSGSRRVRNLLSPFLQSIEGDRYAQYQPVSGEADLADDRLDLVFPEAASRQFSNLMNESLAADLRGWLAEPDFSKTQREPLELDRPQRLLAESRTVTGYRRIRGPAGSGKSVVVAARAARLAAEGKSVLIVTYNITLWHYLRDLIAREIKKPGDMKKIVFCNFHLWCKDVCEEEKWRKRYNLLFRNLPKGEDSNSIAAREKRLKVILETEMPALAKEAASQPHAERYDAIIVDEGQDYRLSWWNALRKSLNSGGEMLLVADTTQDVYGTAKSWTEESMRAAGFVGGPWAELQISYRLPSEAQDMARAFAKWFLPPETALLPSPQQGVLHLDPCNLRWVQCTSHQARNICLEEIHSLMLETGIKDLSNSDITFLCDNVKIGNDVASSLKSSGIEVLSTYSEDKLERDRQKMSFFMGDSRIKATTLHSFKGWETRLLVIYVHHAFSPDALSLIYAGLTRIKRSKVGSWLTVVCAAPQLEEFGTRWPDFIDHSKSDNSTLCSDIYTDTHSASGDIVCHEMKEIYDSLSVGDGEPLYLNDGVWLGPSGDLRND